MDKIRASKPPLLEEFEADKGPLKGQPHRDSFGDKFRIKRLVYGKLGHVKY